MPKITIDTDALMKGASDIAKQIGNLTSINSALKDIINQISSSWSGSASVSYASRMAEYAQQAAKMCNLMEQYKEYVDKAAETFTKLDNGSANKIRSSF